MEEIHIYTDGSCRNNEEGHGSWAYVVVKGEEIIYEDTGIIGKTTSPAAELSAVIKAIDYIEDNINGDHTIIIRSDCKYVTIGINDWMYGWVNRGWRKSNGKLISNIELWKEIYKKWNSKDNDVTIKWIKGHNGNEWNNRAHELAYNILLNFKENLDEEKTA